MSEQGVRAFLERLESDPAFRERLEATPASDARRQIIRDAGFDVGPADLATVRSLTGLQELSDDDLQKVAGGTGTVEAATAGNLPAAAVASAVSAA